VLLALVTKNNPADIEEVFRLRQMPLGLEHFAAVRVNWAPKSQNLMEVADELNLGLDSIIFIDDNRFELEEVRSALPMIETLQFDPGRADSALALLHSVPSLKAWSATAEDLAKADQYAQERQRSQARSAQASLDDYLDSLEIRLQIGCNRTSQVKRIAQLTNKTNQFNLTTRRYSEADIADFMARASVFDIRLVDRFGDMGVVGVVIVADGEIDTFLMSCRALGRGVEGRILRHVIDRAGIPRLRARYLPTRRNGLAETFYDDNGFDVLDVDHEGAKTYSLAGGPPTGRDIPVEEVR
jgi:FkbH-like protein